MGTKNETLMLLPTVKRKRILVPPPPLNTVAIPSMLFDSGATPGDATFPFTIATSSTDGEALRERLSALYHPARALLGPRSGHCFNPFDENNATYRGGGEGIECCYLAVR